MSNDSNYQEGKVTFSVSSDPGADSFSDPLIITGPARVVVYGATWAGTVSLLAEDSNLGWYVVREYTTNKTDEYIDEPARKGIPYKIGMFDGDYTSGSVGAFIQL